MSRAVDVRLLKLYKQHYLDEYTEYMDVDVSTWGYYDGISFVDVPINGDEILPREVFEELWINLSSQTNDINGTFGTQTIGLIRGNVNDIVCNFWVDDNKMPYFAVCFIKLNTEVRKTDYDSFEKMGTCELSDDCSKKEVYTCAYRTLDNADIVLLVHSNSLQLLRKTVERFENYKSTRYIHVISGVRESFLDYCKKSLIKKSNCRISSWEGIECNTDEEIKEIKISFVVSNPEEIVNSIKNKLNKIKSDYGTFGLDELEFSYVFGHESIELVIYNTNVQTLISLMLSGSLITHDNNLYGNGVYNISTNICFAPEKNILGKLTDNKTLISSSSTSNINVNRKNKSNMLTLRSEIAKYKKMVLDKKFKDNDESIYALIISLIRTLNTISQYEGFSLANDIYYLIMPSFKMFLCKIEQYICCEGKEDFDSNKERVKRSCRKYLESVDSIIYHTIHTDQIYLMLPGYCGCSYSTPIILQLFYLWLMHTESELLNDSSYRYLFFITPVVEARPITYALVFKENENDQLVRVRLSHRSLYFVDNMMIILSHEVAHYAGEKIRQRRKRASHIIGSLCNLLVKMYMAPGDYTEKFESFDELNPLRGYLYTILDHELSIKCIRKVMNNIRYKYTIIGEKVFYFSNLEIILKDTLKSILTDLKNGELCIGYKEIKDIRTKFLDKDNSDRRINERLLNSFFSQIQVNAKTILVNNYINKIVSDIIYIYRDIFSDVVSYVIIDYDYDEYEATFEISEGETLCNYEEDRKVQVRKNIMRKLCSSKEENDTQGSVEQPKYNIDTLANDIYSIYPVYNELCNYANECKEALLKHLETENKKDENGITCIRNIYNMIKRDSIDDFDHVINTIGACIANYKEKVSARYDT